MKKFLKILIIIIVFGLIINSSFIIKFYRVNKIINLMKLNSKIDNYYFEDGKKIQKRNKNLIKIYYGSYLNIYYYYDFDNMKYYTVNEDNKYYHVTDIPKESISILNFPLYSSFTQDYSFKNKLKLVFDLNVSVKNYDDNCYEIITEERRIIFDKNSGYILKSENINIPQTDDKDFVNISVNTVSTSDVSIPDLDTYTEYSEQTK